MSKITKIVIPAAGYGTRFLPWTKSMPKEMLPVLDRPVIDYVVAEAVRSGIKDVIIITSSSKKGLEDYFDRNLELEDRLRQTNKTEELKEIQQAAKQANFIFIRQTEQLGNGHAILQAKPALGNQPFVVAWADDIWSIKTPLFKQLIDTHQKYPGNIIALIQSNPKNHADYCDRYANVAGKKVEEGIYKIDKIIEKPGAKNALSNLFAVSNYLFEPDYLDLLEKARPGRGGEIWWNAPLEPLLKAGRVYGKIMEGEYLDVGNPLAFLKANLYFALKDPEIKQELKDYLKKIQS
jgi:UTP--glucose-1-phosphate uridylyltransferase